MYCEASLWDFQQRNKDVQEKKKKLSKAVRASETI